MNKTNMKTYIVEFTEHDQDESQKMTIKTPDIKYTIEQLGRNRSIDKLTVKEVKPVR